MCNMLDVWFAIKQSPQLPILAVLWPEKRSWMENQKNFWLLLGGMVAQVALLPYSSRVPSLFLSLGYCLY